MCPRRIARHVGERSQRGVGKRIAAGRLASNEACWDYTRVPYGYYRVTFGPDERVREVRDLHIEQNFKALQAGLTPSEWDRSVYSNDDADSDKGGR